MGDRVKRFDGILNRSRAAKYFDKNYKRYSKKGRGAIENPIANLVNPYT